MPKRAFVPRLRFLLLCKQGQLPIQSLVKFLVNDPLLGGARLYASPTGPSRRPIQDSQGEVNTMQDRLLRRREVEKITGISRSSIYRLMPDSEFPRPVKVGSAAVRWRESDITAWVESRPVAGGDSGPPNAA